MRPVRQIAIAGAVAALVSLCSAAGVGADPHPGTGVRVPYTPLELVLDAGGVRAVATLASAAAAAAPTTPPPGAAARAGLTFPQAIAALWRAASCRPPRRPPTAPTWIAARISYKTLTGTRKAELGAVLANLTAIAHAGELTPSRVPELTLTLARNRQWWTTGPLLSTYQRVGFPGSGLVWEYYPGQGIEIQWLGTFGAANGLYDQHSYAALVNLLDQARQPRRGARRRNRLGVRLLLRRRRAAVGLGDHRGDRRAGAQRRRALRSRTPATSRTRTRRSASSASLHPLASARQLRPARAI